MDYDFIKLCGFCVAALFLIIIVKGQKKEFGTLLSIGAATVLVCVGTACIYPVVAFAQKLSGDVFDYPYLKLIMKSLAIALLTQFCSEICRDCGEQTLASGVEFAGRAATLGLCLPLIGEMVSLARVLLQG